MTVVPNLEELVRRVDRIQQLTDQLARCRRDEVEPQDFANRIDSEIVAARLALTRENTH